MENTFDGFGERLEQCLKSRNIANKKITEDLNLSKNAIGNYKSGQIPNASILYDISQYLGVTIEWLLSGKDINNITQDEKEIINLYRDCDNTGKIAVQGLLKTLSRPKENEGKLSDSRIG